MASDVANMCAKNVESEVKSAPFSVKVEDKRPRSGSSEITVKEFLNFLKTAYDIQDNLEGILMAEGMTEEVDWIRLKGTEFVKPQEMACQTSLSHLTEQERKEAELFDSETEAEPIKKKLTEVLSEGLFDSVLPYMMPSGSTSRKSSLNKISEKGSHHSISSQMKKKSSSNTSTTPGASTTIRTQSEVEIHVCDEVKNAKKDFVCNQKLLVEQMGYFAEVTAGQRLEEMDISVHCDIGIFEWLMNWVKRDSALPEDRPELDKNCVVPVLVSSAFLQMEPLQQDCLLFCHEHLNEVLRTSANTSCINDAVLSRLAAMYTNEEVEAIRDRKDKIQSRLFCKLVQALCEPEAESVRGHWNSMARVFRCGKCRQLVNAVVGPTLPCIPACMRLLPDGVVRSYHIRDPAWNVNDHIADLQSKLKTWRKVYWRLWGSCHFLYCCACDRHFPAHQFAWCRHHPDPPQFFTLDAQKAPLPVGRYPCCGDRAYRFQLLDNNSGCQFSEHVPRAESVRETAVLNLFHTYRHLVEEEPPQLLFPERVTRLVARDTVSTDNKLLSKETFWWEGLELVPPRPKFGLLSGFRDSLSEKEETPEESEDDYTDIETSSTGSTKSTSSGTPASEESRPVRKVLRTKTKPKKKKKRQLWQHNLSARSNQDLQREYEETTFKKIVVALKRTTSWGCNYREPRYLAPAGGLWVRLESEWREANCFPSQNRFRSIFNTKNRLKPNRIV